MFSGLTLVVPPVMEPISPAEMRAHARVTITTDDSLLLGYIAAARQSCEHFVRRAFLTQTWRLSLRHWPGRGPVGQSRQLSGLPDYAKFNAFKVPLPPLQSVTLFTYTDTQGNVFLMTQGYGNQVGNYLLDIEPEPGEIRLPFSGIWPTTILLPGSPIQLTFVAGYRPLTGMVGISSDGSVRWISGDLFTNIPQSSWITIGNESCVVMSVTDSQNMKLFTAPSSTNIGSPVVYSTNTVPMPLRQAILLLAAHFYENREPVMLLRSTAVTIEIPFAVSSLLMPYIVRGALNEGTSS